MDTKLKNRHKLACILIFFTILIPAVMVVGRYRLYQREAAENVEKEKRSHESSEDFMMPFVQNGYIMYTNENGTEKERTKLQDMLDQDAYWEWLTNYKMLYPYIDYEMENEKGEVIARSSVSTGEQAMEDDMTKYAFSFIIQYDKNGKPMAQILSGSNKSKQLLSLRRALNDVSTSTTQSDWSDDYSGFGPDKYQYKYNSSASWIRSRINSSNGFQSWPWLYVNMKFRPHNGDYRTHTVGGAVDYPIMRIEEMYFLKAEAALHTSGVPAAAKVLEDIVKTRNSAYTCTATTADTFLDEYVFQKGIEFWGEGINYFDAKRLEVGIHRAYKGSNCERYQHCIDMDGAYVGWTPGWNQAELNANPAIFHYNNPYTNPTTYYVFKSNDELRPYYGTEITE